METLQKILQQYSGSSATLGSSDATLGNKTLQQTNRDGLQQELRNLSRKNERYFVIGVAMVIVLFIAMLVVAFFQLRNPTLSQAAPPIFGGTAIGVVFGLFKARREKNYTDCILALVPNVDDETLKTIIAVLVKKI
jgi:hypothetical protein